MRLGIPGGAYLIHGTNRPAGVGMQVTHGCMRLYPEDIEALFNMVPVSTPVMIVNQPYKWGWHQGELLIEVHPPLQEDASTPPTLTDLTRLLVEATRAEPLAIDWIGAERIWREARGIPSPVAAQPPRTASASPAPLGVPRQRKSPAVSPPRGFLSAYDVDLLRHRLFEHAIQLFAVRIAALLRRLRRRRSLVGRVLRRGGSLLCGSSSTARAVRRGLHAIEVTRQLGDLRLERVDFRLQGLQIGAAGAQGDDGGSDAHLQDVGHEIFLHKVAWNVTSRFRGCTAPAVLPPRAVAMRIVTYQRGR